MLLSKATAAAERRVRFCGADCHSCETYDLFLAGDASGLVNSRTGYRCCWLPEEYPEGKDCPIKVCCEGRGLSFCGECDRFDGCERMQAFYAQTGYDALRERMVEVIRGRTEVAEGSDFGDGVS